MEVRTLRRNQDRILDLLEGPEDKSVEGLSSLVKMTSMEEFDEKERSLELNKNRSLLVGIFLMFTNWQ